MRRTGKAKRTEIVTNKCDCHKKKFFFGRDESSIFVNNRWQDDPLFPNLFFYHSFLLHFYVCGIEFWPYVSDSDSTNLVRSHIISISPWSVRILSLNNATFILGEISFMISTQTTNQSEAPLTSRHREARKRAGTQSIRGNFQHHVERLFQKATQKI